MIKHILLAKRKAGMSREDFIDYYENKHVPLAERLFPMLTTIEKRRNFVDHDRVIIPDGFSGEVNYDVITEAIFHDDDLFNRFMGLATDPELAKILTEDEENLFDRDSMRYFFVDVRESERVAE